MNPDELTRHPLFQINLMLFLTMPMPPESGIDPVFAKGGYSLVAIEPALYPDPLDVVRLADAGIKIGDHTRPDLMLQNISHTTFVPLECKGNSFSVNDRDSVRQARKLLLLPGPKLGGKIGVSNSAVWSAILTYLTRDQVSERLMGTLESLTDELQTLGFPTAEKSVLGLFCSATGVHLQYSPRSFSLPELVLQPEHLVMRLSPNENPGVLYLIPMMSNNPDEQDSHAEQAFQEKLRVAVITYFRVLDSSEHRYSLDGLLTQLVPIWPLWKDKGSRGHVVTYTVNFLRATFGRLKSSTGVDCKVVKEDIVIPPVPVNMRKQVRKFFLASLYRGRDMPLFEYTQMSLED